MTIEEFREIKKYLDLGLSVSKICTKLNISKNQVKKAKSMTEEDYFNRDLKPTEYIDRYKDFIIDILRVTPTTKDTNVLFRIQNEFPDFTCKRITFYRDMKNLRIENGYDEYVNKKKKKEQEKKLYQAMKHK